MVQIEALSNLEFQGVPCQHGQNREEHRVGPNRSPISIPECQPIEPIVHLVQNEQYKCVCVIMKVQLVTHSIIPNLNSGLVPIDLVGLVFSYF